MALIVADSDVLIEYLRNRSPVADQVRRAIERGRLATTAISAYELTLGARTERQLKQVERLLRVLGVRSFDYKAGEVSGNLYRVLQQRGVSVPFADFLIAGIRIASGLPLWTRNLSDYERIPGLTFSHATEAT